MAWQETEAALSKELRPARQAARLANETAQAAAIAKHNAEAITRAHLRSPPRPLRLSPRPRVPG